MTGVNPLSEWIFFFFLCGNYVEPVVVVCCLACLPATIQPASQRSLSGMLWRVSGARPVSPHCTHCLLVSLHRELHRPRVARPIRRPESVCINVCGSVQCGTPEVSPACLTVALSKPPVLRWCVLCVLVFCSPGEKKRYSDSWKSSVRPALMQQTIM